MKDHLGSTRAVVDETGTVMEAYEYYPFGRISRSYINGTGVDEKFTGKELDNDNDERMYYFGARYYDADLGIWLRIDPLAHLRPGLSPYNYVQNNPLNRFDPNGMIDWSKVGWGTLTTIGGLATTVTGGTLAAATSVTVVGAVGGASLMVHGLATTGFGVTQIVAGFVESDTDIPGGPLEAIGKGVGGETGSTIGALLDGGIGLKAGVKSIKGSLKKIDKLFPGSAREAKAIKTIDKVQGTLGLGDVIGTTKSAEDVRSNYVEIIDDDDEDENKEN